MQNKYIASFCPLDSLIHKINAAIKIVGLIFFVVLLCVTSEKLMLVLCGGLTIGLILFSNVPIKFYFKIIFSFIYLYLLLVIVFVLFGMNILTAWFIILKVILLFLNIMLIIHTTSAEDIVVGVTKLVNIFNFFNLNLNKFGIISYQVIKFVPTIFQTANQVLNSQAIRGTDYKYCTIIGKWFALLKCLSRIFTITKEKLKLFEISMKQRLFILRENTRKIQFSKLNTIDYVYLGLIFLLILFYIMRIKG